MGRRPASDDRHPQIVQFRVAGRAAAPYRLPSTLSASFRRLTLDTIPKNTPERLVLTTPVSGMSMLWELEEVPNDTITVQPSSIVTVAGRYGDYAGRMCTTAICSTTRTRT